MKQPLLKIVASLLASAAFSPAMAAPLQFKATYLGDFYATGINNSGQISGFDILSGEIKSLVYSNGSVDYLAAPDGSRAYGINDAGQVIGEYNNQAFLYSNGNFTTIGSTGTRAAGINNAGQVVGSATGTNQTQGFVYANGIYTNLGSGSGYESAASINNAGQIGGSKADNGNSLASAYIYGNGSYTDIGATVPLPPFSNSSYTAALNDNGVAVINNMFYAEARLGSYVYANGVTTQIGASGGYQSSDINNLGIVVGDRYGYEGFLWQDGQTYNLASLVFGGLNGYSITGAAGINESNQIAVRACQQWGGCGTFLLEVAQPVPEPQTYAMMLGGLGLLGWMARRRRASSKA